MNTVFWCCLLFPLALLKLISPALLRRRIDPLLNALAVAWVSVNNVWFGWIQQRALASFCSSNYGTDASFRREFHRWLARQWEEKDLLISQLTGVSNTGGISGTNGAGQQTSAG